MMKMLMGMLIRTQFYLCTGLNISQKDILFPFVEHKANIKSVALNSE